MAGTELVPVEARSSFDLLPQAHELAIAIAKTEFVPSALRNRPEAVMACVLAGHEIGIGPMQALAKIHIIEGKPGLAAELMRALVLAAGHDLWFEEKSATKVTVCGQRRGTERVSKVTWTMDDAQRAGLSNKQNYRKIPRQMLTARATAELARDMFPDVIGGMYAVEELQDGFGFEETPDGDVVPEPTAPPATTRRRATRAPGATKAAGAVKASPPLAAAPPPPPLPGEIDDDIVDAEVIEDDVERGVGELDVVKASARAFDAEGLAAPKGKKTFVMDRLRHAAIFAATRRRVWSLKQTTPEELPKILVLLHQIEDGTVTVSHDALDDNAGVTFTLSRPGHADGDKSETVLWSEMTEEET
jgi:hypothetical protein